MEKLCIDVRGFTDEKKKRVQDAFFELGYEWSSRGKGHAWLSDYSDEIYYITTHNKLARGDLEDGESNITYTDLMRKAGMDESGPDVWPNLQPGDYTTREEIKVYAEREGVSLKDAYQRVCDAFVSAGAPLGEGIEFVNGASLIKYGWSKYGGAIYFASADNTVDFTRHLTPEQILNAGKQQDLQPEKQAEKVEPKQIGELTLGVELTTDLQSVISDYLFLLDSIKDPYARGVIKSQITDLTDLQYRQLTGENNA